ncbi:C1 family peptidase [Ancylobacter sp. TS-1]|uniref:C1 family peptidase n=1 Tax=Ancylobacter sp. TS-1 TaxID=1850374 RepID=UPI001265D4CD|nr:C1 family peptidase [Ancylobacter sp. TS-1]QFR33419.1 DUF4384 domain-containing protein [Ancylobacter sp. TS-1]
MSKFFTYINIKKIHLSFIFSILASAGGAWANEEDTQDVIYSTGAVMADERVTSSFSQAVKFRNFLPPAVDLSARLPSPGNQGRQGSCVGWAVGYAARSYYVGLAEGRRLTDPVNIPSPAHIYGRALKREGTTDCDTGMRIFEALDDLRRGSLSLSQLPYDERACPHPRASAEQSPLDFKIDSWKFIPKSQLDTIKGELSDGHPLVFDMALALSFHKYRRGGVYRRGAESADTGRHAMVIIGYDEARQAFRIQNSWGEGWGDRGRGWLSYDTFREDVGGVYSMRPMPLVTPPRITPPPVTPPPGPAPAPPPVPVAQDITGEVGVTCAKLELSSTGDRRTVRGFVGSPEDLEKVRTSKVAQGATIEVAVRKWPQCEVLLTLDPWLVGGGELAVSIAEGAPERRAGEAMPIKVVTPAWPSYVNVAYIQADGSVLHLVQTDPANLRTLSPRRDLAFGDGAEGRSTFRASAPFGAEMAVVIASSSPLFADARPRKETERDFLTALRRALLWRPDPDAPARRIVAGVAAVTTREK